jgi:O-antigen ligase/Tfp pilus assembly protein PilF
VLLPLPLAILAYGHASALPTKESLTLWSAVLATAVWLILRSNTRRMPISPIDLPVLILWLIAGIHVLAQPNIWPESLRSFILLTTALAYAKVLSAALASRRMRSLSLRLIVFCLGITAGIALLMDQGIHFWVFQPVEIATETGRHTVASTIGHNASVASILMAGFFLGLAVLSESTRRWVHVLLLAYLLVVLYVLVAARTVAIWLTAPFLVSLFTITLLYRYRHAASYRNYRRYAAIALFVFIMGALLWTGFLTLQSSSPEGSPISRLSRLEPEVLLRGTRLRLWRIGLGMIRENPWGVGLAGFKSFYAEYQGRYFENYPGSSLVPTALRPGRAHNEYLQVLIELGWPGAIVMLWLLFSFFRWILSIVAQPERSITPVCIVFAMLVPVLHNLVAFEFHVVSSAFLFIFGYAWLSGASSRKVSLCPVVNNWKRIRFWAPAVLLFALPFQMLAARYYQAEELFLRAHQARKTGYLFAQKGNRDRHRFYYLQAAEDFLRAARLAPHRGDFLYYAGWCQLESGRLLASAGLENKAEEHLRLSVKLFNQAETQYQQEVLYRYRAEAYTLLGQIAAARDQKDLKKELFSQAEKDLKKALWIQPRSEKSFDALGRFYLSTGRPQEAVNVWKEGEKRLPGQVDRLVSSQARKFLGNKRWKQAWHMAQYAIQADPDSKSAYNIAIRSALALGEEKQDVIYRQCLERAERDPEFRKSNWIYFALKDMEAGRFEKVEKKVNQVLAERPRNVPAMLVKSSLFEKTGREDLIFPVLEKRLALIKNINRSNWKLFKRMAWLKYRHDGLDEALEFLQKILSQERFSSSPEFQQVVLELRESIRQKDSST